jgi:hypothetical protein
MLIPAAQCDRIRGEAVRERKESKHAADFVAQVGQSERGRKHLKSENAVRLYTDCMHTGFKPERFDCMHTGFKPVAMHANGLYLTTNSVTTLMASHTVAMRANASFHTLNSVRPLTTPPPRAPYNLPYTSCNSKPPATNVTPARSATA